jgi:hypothetical protein
MPDFDRETYWADKEYKKWVVNLGNTRGGRDKKYVSARTEAGAILTGRIHSHLKGRVSASARLATPMDLGATRTEL